MRTTAVTLQGMSAPIAERRWDFDKSAQVGRLSLLPVAIDDDSVSRTHAQLVPEERGWVVYDLGSTNGTYVNGERVGRAGHLLRAGDTVYFGDVMVAIKEIAVVGTAAATSSDPVLRASTLCTWETLADQRQRQPADVLLHLARIGRTALPQDSLEAYLQSVLWYAAEVLNAAHGTLALAGDDSDLQWKAQLSESFGGGGDLAVWSRPELMQAALAASRSALFEINGTFVLCALLRVGERRLGILGLARDDTAPAFTESDLATADALALAASPSVRAMALSQERQETLLIRTLTTFTQLVHLRDHGTASHAHRVTDYSLLLAARLGLSKTEQHYLRIGTPLHDLGKVGLEDATLAKAGPLSAHEMARVRGKVVRAAELLEQIPSLRPLIPIVRNCRERWDGSGYPDGLSGRQIPILARIVAVADAFDAMTTDQPYRTGMEPQQAFRELEAGAGSQFDPQCTAAFLQLGDDLEESLRRHAQSTRTLSMSQLRAHIAAVAGKPTATVRRPS